MWSSQSMSILKHLRWPVARTCNEEVEAGPAKMNWQPCWKWSLFKLFFWQVLSSLLRTSILFYKPIGQGIGLELYREGHREGYREGHREWHREGHREGYREDVVSDCTVREGAYINVPSICDVSSTLLFNCISHKSQLLCYNLSIPPLLRLLSHFFCDSVCSLPLIFVSLIPARYL